jgi:hypothetical protein
MVARLRSTDYSSGPIRCERDHEGIDMGAADGFARWPMSEAASRAAPLVSQGTYAARRSEDSEAFCLARSQE